MQLVRLLRSRQQKALHLITTQRAKHLHLLSGFDTFGNHAQVQGVCHLDQCLQDHHTIVRVIGALHKDAVDLESIGIQFTQATERRVACTEIVD